MERKAAIYARISRLAGKERDKEGAGLGVTRQQKDCETLAAQLGWHVASVYVDDDTSAYSGKPRKQYERLLADLRHGDIDAVLCWHTDRLHRSPAELEHYIDVCQPRDIVTQTVKAGNIDLSTPSGRMIARQLGVIARYEVEHMAERQRSQKLQAAGAGQWLGGRRPFGFKADGMTIDPEEASEVINASEDILAGVSLNAIKRDLNARGVLTSTGSRWASTEVRRMLLRPRNAGIMVHQQEEVGAAAWPALVSEEVFRGVQRLLIRPERRTAPMNNSRRYLGSGIYLCGSCNDGTTVRTSSAGGYSGRSHHPAYCCRKAKHLVRSVANVDRYVQQVIIERLSQPDAKELLREQPDEVDVPALRAEAAALRQRLADMLEMWGALELTTHEYRIAKQRADARLEEVEAEMAHAVTTQPLAALIADEDIESAWYGLDLAQRRSILTAFMTVTLCPADHKGRLPGGGYFDPSKVEIDFIGD